MTNPGCDFCSKDIPSIKEYACADFTVGALIKDGEPVNLQRMVGNWHACQVCMYFIECNDRTALAKHSVDLILDAENMSHIITADQRKIVLASVLACHDGFFANRITRLP